MTTSESKNVAVSFIMSVKNSVRRSPTKLFRPNKDRLNATPARVKQREKEEFHQLKDVYEAQNFESIDDHDKWDKVLCDRLGNPAQAAEWYEWYRLLSSHQGRQEVHSSMEPDTEPYMRQDIFKKNLSNANWETGNTEYCAVADFLWNVNMRDQDNLILLGCLNNLLLSVRVDIEAFFLQNLTIISEEPRFSKLGRDPIIRHMTYLRDYESNIPNIASPGSKAFEIDFIPLGRIVCIQRPSDESIAVMETGSWMDTGLALAWSISEKSSENFRIVRCDANVDTWVPNNLDRSTPTKETGVGHFDVQSLSKDAFTVAKIAPGGVDLLKNNLKETLESEDIKLLYESKSAPTIVRAVGQPHPLNTTVRYEQKERSQSTSDLGQGNISEN